MTNEQQMVKKWMTQFQQETPDRPTIPSLEVRKLRAKLILEEALETIEALGFYLTFSQDKYSRRTFYVAEKQIFTANLKDIADGCEDLKVVTEGTLVACGLVKEDNYRTVVVKEYKDGEEELGGSVKQENLNDEDPLFNKVMRSNFSKLWTTEEVNTEAENRQNKFKRTLKGWTYEEIIKNKWLVKDREGKVIKSPSYSPPNLQPIIDEMSR